MKILKKLYGEEFTPHDFKMLVGHLNISELKNRITADAKNLHKNLSFDEINKCKIEMYNLIHPKNKEIVEVFQKCNLLQAADNLDVMAKNYVGGCDIESLTNDAKAIRNLFYKLSEFLKL